jgi:PEP-CTERM motif
MVIFPHCNCCERAASLAILGFGVQHRPIMSLLRKVLVAAAITYCFSFIAIPTLKADPLSFSNVVALQNGGFTLVDLFANPAVSLVGPQITFRVDLTGDLPASGNDILRITYTEAGQAPVVQEFQIPIFQGVSLPYSQLFSINSPGASFQGVAATLTVDIVNTNPDFIIPGGPNAGQHVDSFSFAFNVTEPVPEPSSLLLLGSGMVGWIVNWRAKRQPSAT